MKTLLRYHLVKLLLLCCSVGVFVYGVAGNKENAFLFIFILIGFQIRTILAEENSRKEILKLREELKDKEQ